MGEKLYLWTRQTSVCLIAGIVSETLKAIGMNFIFIFFSPLLFMACSSSESELQNIFDDNGRQFK